MKHKMLIITMLLLSLFQMGMVGLTPVISELTNAFPGTSELTAQLATTFLNLILVLVALLSGPISRKIGRRWMSALGMLLFVLAGVGGAFFTVRLELVFLWSGLLGAGTGLFVPAVSSMMIDYLAPEEREAVAGWQTAAVNAGGVLISLGAGLLAAQFWTHAYLVFLFALPMIFLSLHYVPAESRSMKKKTPGTAAARIPSSVWVTTIKAVLFTVLYFVFSTNISLLLAEKGYMATTLAGTASAFFMLGGGICGLLFKKAYRILSGKTAALAFSMVSLSYFVICLFDGLMPLYFSALIGGGSLSLIFPFFLVTVANRVEPEVSVISASLILSVGPNLGSFLSPLIITNLSNAFVGNDVIFRFLLSAILAAFGAIAFFLLDCRAIRKSLKYHPEFDPDSSHGD